MHPTTAAVIAGLAAFGTYSCMYAYRKPYTAATFDGSPTFLGLDYKTALVIAQVIGYAASKFLGIKFVSETSPSGRGKRVLLLIALAQVALLAFATLPESWKVAALVLNGLPLGMVWGLVFSYLEGRRLTEVMGLILCCSFIFASAITKDVGRWVMELGASEYWMPFLVGILFAPWLLLFVWVLEHTGPPSRLDKRLRTERAPMSRLDRKVVFARFAPGLILLVAVYTMLTGYRDFRDNFLADILTDLRGTLPEVAFSRIEIPVMLLVLGALMTLVKIRDNMTAFIVNHLILLAAFVTAGVATLLFSAGWLSDTTWLITTGFSTYSRRSVRCV